MGMAATATVDSASRDPGCQIHGSNYLRDE